MSIFNRRALPAQAETRTGFADLMTLGGYALRSDTYGTFATPKTAPGVVGYGAAVNLFASATAMLPIDFYRTMNGKTEEIDGPTWLLDPEGQGFGFSDFVYKVCQDIGYFGNVFSEDVSRDGMAYPTQIKLDPPETVRVQINNDSSWAYQVDKREVRPVMSGGQMRHLRRYPKSGQVLGVNPVQQYASTLGLALASERFGGDWFSDGAHPSSILSSSVELDEEQARTLKNRFLSAVRGRREPAVLNSAITYTPIQSTPDASRLIDTMKFTSAQAARVLGPGFPALLGYEIGGSLTYSNTEQQAISFLQYSLDPHLVIIENWLSSMLPRGTRVKFNRDAILRVDAKTRAELFRIALGPMEPWTYANEVRDTLDMPPTKWGDEKPAVKSPIADEPAGETPSTSVPAQTPKTQES